MKAGGTATEARAALAFRVQRRGVSPSNCRQRRSAGNAGRAGEDATAHADVLEIIRQKQRQGLTSLREIAAALNTDERLNTIFDYTHFRARAGQLHA